MERDTNILIGILASLILVLGWACGSMDNSQFEDPSLLNCQGIDETNEDGHYEIHDRNQDDSWSEEDCYSWSKTVE